MSQKLGVVVRQRRRARRRARGARAPGPARRAAPGPGRAARRPASRPRRPACRRSTRPSSPRRASRASAWTASAGWFASSLPRSASTWTTRPRGRKRVVVAGQLAEAAADDEQHVGVLEQVRGVPVLQPGLQRQRVLPRERTLGAEGHRDRRAERLGELEQRCLGAGPDDAAAGQDRPAARRRRSSRAASSSSSARGAGSRGATARSVTGGMPASPSSTSWGISTQVGPYGGRQCGLPRGGQGARDLPGLGHDCSADFTTSRTLARWSRSSCR